MSLPMPDVGEIMSLNGAICFIAGALAMRAYYFFRDRRHNRNCPDRDRIETRWKTTALVWVVIGVAVAYSFSENYRIGEQTRETSYAIRHLAEQVQACQQSIISVQQERSRIASIRDDYSEQSRKLLADGQDALLDWVQKLINPPAEIAKLDLNSKQRQDYGVSVTQEFYGRNGEIQRRLDHVQESVDRQQAELRAKPIQTPQCEKLR